MGKTNTPISIYYQSPHILIETNKYTLPDSHTRHHWQHIDIVENEVGPIVEETMVNEALRHGAYDIAFHTGGSVILSARYDGRCERGWSTPGMFCLTPPQGPTYWTCSAPGRVCHLFLSTELFKIAAADEHHSFPVADDLPFRFNVRDPFVEQVCWALRAEMYHPGPVSNLYVDILSQSLAVHILRQSIAARQLRDTNVCPVPAAIHRVVEYIEANIAASNSLRELAAVANLSPSTFSRQFKQVLGVAPHQYLLRRRVDRACELLREGQLTIPQIAQATGFADQSHLARWVRHFYNVSPSDLWRGKM